MNDQPLRLVAGTPLAARVHVVLVLGHQLDPGDRMPAYMEERLMRVACLWNPSWDMILLSGGITEPGQRKSEASVMRDWLQEMGVSWDIIHCDDQSLDSVENIRNALIMLRKLYGEHVIQVQVVTHSWHMERVLAICTALSLDDNRFIFKPEAVTGKLPLRIRIIEGLKTFYAWFDPELKLARKIRPLRASA